MRAGQAAGFEDQRGVRVIEIDDLRVGRVAGVFVAEAAADADRTRGELVFAEEPAGDVHLMDALVAHVAVAGVPVPMPIVVDAGTIEILLLGRAAPEVVIERRGNLQRRFEFADAEPRLVAGAERVLDLAELAAADEGDGILEALAGARLGAALHEAVVLAGGLDHLPAFPDVVRDGLLDVDVLAGLSGGDGDPGMRVIRRGDRDGVDVFAFEQLAEVGVGVELVAVPLLEAVGHAVEDLFIDVAEGDEIAMIVADVTFALAVETDLGETDVGNFGRP